MNTCKTCGTSFEPKRWAKGGNYCSGACYYARGPDGPRKASVKDARYRLDRTHPLAPPSGRVAISRLVLYDKLGAGPHKCHWCGSSLDWKIGTSSHDPDALFVDHLDWNRLNDEPENLVASCCSCNARRAAPGKRGAIQPSEPTLIVNGRQTRAIEVNCEDCGEPFLTLPSKPRRFCSRGGPGHCAHHRLTPDEIIARLRAGHLDTAHPTALELETAEDIRLSNEELFRAFRDAFAAELKQRT